MNIFSRRIWWRQWCKKHSTDTSYTKVVFHSWILNSRIELGPRANYFNLQCHASQKRQDSSSPLSSSKCVMYIEALSVYYFWFSDKRNSRTNLRSVIVTLHYFSPSRESDPTISGQTHGIYFKITVVCDIWKILYSTSQYPPTEEDASNGDRHFDKQNPKWCLKIHQFKLVEFTRWMPGFD